MPDDVFLGILRCVHTYIHIKLEPPPLLQSTSSKLHTTAFPYYHRSLRPVFLYHSAHLISSSHFFIMKFQTLFTLAALGSGTLAFPAWPSYFSSKDSTDMTPPYPKPTEGGQNPTGDSMTGVHRISGFPSGYPKHTGAHGTGHHKSVYPTDTPILPRHRPHPTGGYPMTPGSIPPMPSNDPTLSSLKTEHFSGPHTTEPFTMDPFPTGGPMYSKRDASAPYPSDAKSDAEQSGDFSTGRLPHKTGAHSEPTGMPMGTGKPEGYPKYSKQY